MQLRDNKLVLNLTFSEALIAGVYPFIIKDLVVTALGIMVALIVKKRLKKVVKLGVKA